MPEMTSHLSLSLSFFQFFFLDKNNTDFHIILPFIAIRGTPAEVSNAPVVRSSFFNTLK